MPLRKDRRIPTVYLPDGNSFAYAVRRRHGARALRLQFFADGRLVLSAPKTARESVLIAFVQSRAEWIYHTKQKVDAMPKSILASGTRTDFLAVREEASVLAAARLEHFNRSYGFSWNRVTIRDQKSRWGSCSKKGNVNFNYRIAFLPPELADYIIVHELCHLEEFNHSPKFWSLMGKTIPDYRERRKKLKLV
ncbi:MAG: hypothetical protein A2808_02435 [Candidatus Moranbacteria bacterium RIFCSPHIGHO2_01_FULL_55_24]|nr:MAG: hypothetical protein A2808_02435 [Candidatus Moranbacteria bacterium RIFCSPHIGHO2_01_FULL_55_24]